ncbi:peptidoglycan DD-metalloendopeptidase family protein [Sphingomonas sp. MG17]|uniref:Peptidoglycan DD-metalloendopeptidase family protein n=1 Tax=Sphingomonas tagetis TaxID=2949092 RepID=A0A9X2HLU3_9SPHN|nr:peptidoglycan DD-metalloendopeptidase family protein [Sphingomonas tagetis]MCP3732007.1 peptidoglycan DD-metalloendopeptidase family protein [Sphingomonas tagetis]
MGRQSTDIIARLQLNGAQFSSETQRVFGQMQNGARAAAADLKSEFTNAYQQIERMAQTAVTAPRTKSGSLDINAAGARLAAQAAEAEAIALREVANAAERLAKQKGALTEANSAQVMGMRAAADAAEAHARAMVQQANFADLLQAELGQTASATELIVAKNLLLERSTRGGGMAAMQAGQQFQDFAIQVQSGQNPIVAASQQLSQLGAVLYASEGAAGKFGRFLAGGWGTMLFIGVAALSTFISAISKSGNEVANETKELEKNAQKTRLMEAAKAAYARTVWGHIEALKKETAALEAQNRTIEQNIQLQRDRLYAQLNSARGDRPNIALNQLQAQQQLETAKEALRIQKELMRDPGAAGDAARATLHLYQQEVERLQKRIESLNRARKENEEMIAAGERGMRQIDRQESDIRVQERIDPEAKAAGEKRRALQKLAEQYDANRISLEKYEAEKLKAEKRYQAQIEAIRATAKAERDAGSAREQRMKLLDPVTGGQVRSGFGARTPPKAGASSNHKGIDIAVPVGTGVRAGADGVVVSVGNMGKLGKAVIVDYGDKVIATYGHLSEILVAKGQTVSAGDTIARSGNTGNSTGPHLHYGVTKDGRPIDPRRATVREGAGDKAATDAARERAEQQKREADQRDRILAASQKQLDVEAESLRFIGMRVRGLDEEAAVEADIARKQREHYERMAELTAADRAEQSKVHPMLIAALAVLRSQADIYADLVEKAGDQTDLTEDQRKALDDANAAMLTQLDAARTLAKTAEERFQIEAAIARVQARLSTAQDKGNDRSKAEKRAIEEAEKDREKSDRDLHERRRDQIYSLASFYRDAMDGGTKGIVQRFRDEMKDAIAEIAARYTVALLTGQKTSLGSILSDMGATSGGGGGGLLGALGGLLGGKSKADKFAGGLMPGGEIFGATKASGVLGGLGGIGSAISSALPYAAIAMAVLPMITSLFTSPKWGSASLSLNGGVVSGAQGVGKGASQIKAATGNAGSVAEGINRLAEQLGATISSIPGVTIGSWDGKARVALTSTNAKLHSKNFGPDVLKDFGEGGEQEAIQYAIQYAFTNAALEGISQASKNIIKAGGDDVASAITKALLIEDVPKRLQAIIDPVGYAVDTFNKSWEKTIAALKEGGASAEQMAEAQKLYKLELEQTKASAQEASADLKAFLNGLNMGSSSPYSIRDQERMAYNAFKPFEEAILRGERVDQGKFTEAAQTWLDLQRQLFGSTGSFFEAMDKVQSLTNKAISDIDNAKPIRVETDPWVKATATSTQASAELLSQVSDQLSTISAQLAAMGGGSGGEFIGADGRLFDNRAA